MTGLNPAVIVGDALDAFDEPPRPLFRELPPATPFPVECLGPHLEPAAMGIHDKTQAPMAICGQAVLAAASLAAQGLADVQLPTGAKRPLSLFAVTVAASGERKSAVDELALKPVRDLEVLFRQEYAAEIERHGNDLAAWKTVREQALKAHKKDRAKLRDALEEIGSAPRAPMLPILTVSEPNYTGLVRAFDEGRPALGLFSAEGGAFIGGWGMSDENRLRTATGLSELWDGSPIQRARGGDGVRVLPGRRLALHLMAQPDVAHRLIGNAELIDQGLVSRLLVSAPDTAAGTRLWREPPPGSDAALRDYTGRILHVLRAPLPLARDEDRALDPPALALAVDARALWIKTADAIERQMGPGSDLEPIRGLAGKAPEHAARIAGVLQVVDDIEAREISAWHMAAGVRLVEHYLAEALRLQAAGSVNSDLRLAQRALDWLRNRWTEPMFSLPDLYQRGPRTIRDRSLAKRVVDTLQDHGWIVEAGENIVSGTRRNQTWRLRRGFSS